MTDHACRHGYHDCHETSCRVLCKFCGKTAIHDCPGGVLDVQPGDNAFSFTSYNVHIFPGLLDAAAYPLPLGEKPRRHW